MNLFYVAESTKGRPIGLWRAYIRSSG